MEVETGYAGEVINEAAQFCFGEGIEHLISKQKIPGLIPRIKLAESGGKG